MTGIIKLGNWLFGVILYIHCTHKQTARNKRKNTHFSKDQFSSVMSSSLWDVKPIEIPGVHYDDPCHERWNKRAKTGTDVQVWSQYFFKYSWDVLKGFLTLMEVDGSAGRRFSRYWKSNTKVFIKVMEFQAISQTGMYTLWFIVVSTKWYDHRWQSISSTFFRTLKENMDLKRWYLLTTSGFHFKLPVHCLHCLHCLHLRIHLRLWLLWC